MIKAKCGSRATLGNFFALLTSSQSQSKEIKEISEKFILQDMRNAIRKYEKNSIFSSEILFWKIHSLKVRFIVVKTFKKRSCRAITINKRQPRLIGDLSINWQLID